MQGTVELGPVDSMSTNLLKVVTTSRISEFAKLTIIKYWHCFSCV